MDSQLLSTFDCFFRQRRNIFSRPNSFFFGRPNTLPFQFPKMDENFFFKTPLDSLEFFIYSLEFHTKESLTPTNSTKFCPSFRSFILRPKTKIPRNFTWFLKLNFCSLMFTLTGKYQHQMKKICHHQIQLSHPSSSKKIFCKD